MNIAYKNIGPLRVLETEGDPDDGVIVLFHGYGANAPDLAALSQEIQLPGNRQPRWIFPEGILTLDGSARAEGGPRAWWHIDPAAVERAMATGTHRDLSGPAPEGMDQALERTREFLEGIETSRLVIGGFSQGAMISSHLSLMLKAAPTGLLLFSGNAIDVRTLEERAGARAGLRFFQSHGTFDPILSLPGARRLFDIFTTAGLKGDFHEFPGVHEIPRGAIEGAGKLLSEVLV
jgi:phospholipase/carboxylesterase